MAAIRVIELCLLAGLAALPARAAEPAPAPAGTQQQTVQQKIDAAISRLGDPDFKAREQASDELRDIGVVALPSLQKATSNPDPEVKVRARALINELQPPKEPDRYRDLLRDTAPGQVQIFINGRPVNLGPQVVGRIQRAVTVINNQRRINVLENDRTIEIIEDPTGIKMTVTETVDGKPRTEKYAAKNAEELKKKSPEAFKLYERHARENVRRIGPRGAMLPQPPQLQQLQLQIDQEPLRIEVPAEIWRQMPPDMQRDFVPVVRPGAVDVAPQLKPAPTTRPAAAGDEPPLPLSR